MADFLFALVGENTIAVRLRKFITVPDRRDAIFCVFSQYCGHILQVIAAFKGDLLYITTAAASKGDVKYYVSTG